MEKVAESMLSLEGVNVSRHWDELIKNDLGMRVSLFQCRKMFEKLLFLIRQSGEARTLIWAINISEADHLSVSQTVSLNLMVECRDISIYLYQGSDFLDNAFEDYRIELLELVGVSMKGIYRSWRSYAAFKKGWGFSNDIYLWSRAGHETGCSVQ